MNEEIEILLVDDEALLVDSLEIILSLTDGMHIVGKALDGKEALGILSHVKADIALVDLNMKGMGGLELIKHMKQVYPKTKILVLTTFYDEKNIINAVSLGADGYILKDSGREKIISAIKNVISGQSVLDSKVLLALSKAVGTYNDDKLDKTQLTPRELEILDMIGTGLTNAEIARRLYISEGTVKNYVSSIYEKTGVHDRAQLALRASK